MNTDDQTLQSSTETTRQALLINITVLGDVTVDEMEQEKN